MIRSIKLFYIRQVYAYCTEDETHFKVDLTCSFIEESCEFDDRLFTDTISTATTPTTEPTRGRPLINPRFLCVHWRCRYECKRKNSLKAHYLKHCKILPFKCNVSDCNNRFASKKAVIEHLSSHPVPRGYKCPFCEFAAYEINEMNEHVEIHASKIRNVNTLNTLDDSNIN
ncbi:Zinc finger protein Eos [Thelohanellus kitauei]|uniref:Zinc finger protein Eos n=1 Tax=Thelohanellus kitauei TaxID=669202 RepID=A0A0C2J504_THEKT|nr:Zinc finger protein Eos [Thelohanellus kitauei]